MTEKQKKILDIFENLIPKCSDAQQEKILNFGEAIAYMVEHQEQKTEKTA